MNFISSKSGVEYNNIKISDSKNLPVEKEMSLKEMSDLMKLLAKKIGT